MSRDIIQLLYKELFAIRLLHSGFLQGQESFLFHALDVAADEETKKLFRNYQLDYRCINDAIVCFMRSRRMTPTANEPKVPFVPFSGERRIRFLLTATSDFFHKTFAAAAGSKVVYHFTNKIDNVQSGDMFISKTVGSYNAANDYDAGVIVESGGELFATLKPVSAADAIPLSDTDYWKKITPVEQVVNVADLSDVGAVKPDKTCFAVIDIFNAGTTSSSYDLFGGSGQLLSPVYTIRFKSKI